MVETDSDGGNPCLQEKVESAALQWLMIRVESPMHFIDPPCFEWTEKQLHLYRNRIPTD